MSSSPMPPARWNLPILILGVIGACDALYLLLNSLFPSIPLECLQSGPINCGAVTSSPFSHIDGIPVALFALAWFIVLPCIALTRRPSSLYQLAIFPLWVAGALMVGYLVSIEAFVIHAICLYCTLAHICALLLGVPVSKLAFHE